jgi:hypothetical protein
MPVTIHAITRYTVQVLTRKEGEHAHSYITVRLYDHDNVNRGTTVFERYGDTQPPKPVGDHDDQKATAYMDTAHYRAYMDILRLESPIYLKMSWTQQGNIKVLSHVSIDTKKEVIGEFFGRSP